MIKELTAKIKELEARITALEKAREIPVYKPAKYTPEENWESVSPACGKRKALDTAYDPPLTQMDWEDYQG